MCVRSKSGKLRKRGKSAAKSWWKISVEKSREMSENSFQSSASPPSGKRPLGLQTRQLKSCRLTVTLCYLSVGVYFVSFFFSKDFLFFRSFPGVVWDGVVDEIVLERKFFNFLLVIHVE